MGLKAVIDKLEDAPEAVRSLYVAKDGKFVLDVEGVVSEDEYSTLNTKLAEFRDNNIALNKRLESLKDVDPVEYRKVKAEYDRLKASGIGKADDIEVRIQKAIEAATDPLTRTVEALKGERDSAQKALEHKQLSDDLWAVGVKAGVREEAKDFWLSEAAKTFKRDNGTLVGFNGDRPLFSQRKGGAGNPMTPDEWAVEVAPRDPKLAILYKGSKGAGGNNADRVQDTGDGRRVISNDPASVSQNLEAIAKGTVVVHGTL